MKAYFFFYSVSFSSSSTRVIFGEFCSGVSISPVATIGFIRITVIFGLPRNPDEPLKGSNRFIGEKKSENEFWKKFWKILLIDAFQRYYYNN